jgi:dTMP kinase
MAGRFITFEGGEGVGKSTQVRLLAQALEQSGVSVVITREPGGTKGAEAIRTLLLDPEGEGWSPEAEVLLFAAARADHVERVIRPALDAGKWVLCDRFVDSTRAYQGGEGSVSDADVLTLHRIGSKGLLPDLTVLLEARDRDTAERLRARDGNNSDRIGGRDQSFHHAVARRFASIAVREPDRFARVDGNGTPEDVHRRILTAVQDRLGLIG